jgi:hypothetical protein
MQIAWFWSSGAIAEVTRCSHALSGSFAFKEVGTLSYTVRRFWGADTRDEEGLSSGAASTSGGRRM